MSFDPTIPGQMPTSWAEEMPIIKAAAEAAGLQPEFVAAIRKAENGAHPYDAFGVLSIPFPERDTYAKQLDICCVSVLDRLAELDQTDTVVSLYRTPRGHKRLVYCSSFIEAFAKRWAPGGADNDPTGLNARWAINATAIYYQFINQGSS